MFAGPALSPLNTDTAGLPDSLAMLLGQILKPPKSPRGSRARGFGFSARLELQVAPNNGPLYPKVAHKWAKVAHNYSLLAFQVRSKFNWDLESELGREAEVTLGPGCSAVGSEVPSRQGLIHKSCLEGH